MHGRIGFDLGEQLTAPDIDLLRRHIMSARNIRNAEAARRRLSEGDQG